MSLCTVDFSPQHKTVEVEKGSTVLEAAFKAGITIDNICGGDGICGRCKMIVVEGTLYPLLTRLKNAGLLAYRWEESTQGPPRKYYELTENGRNFLGELEGSWGELVDAVTTVKANRA